MGKLLFDMSDSELNREIEAHFDRMYDQYYGYDEPEPCCANCKYHFGSQCCLSDYDDSVEDYVDVDDDDYCDSYKLAESDEW